MALSSDDAARRPYHHSSLRTALIEAGSGHLERGDVTLTLRTAANQAGVTRTAPYNHFPDKDALLAAIAIRGFEDLKTATEDSRRAAGPARMRAISVAVAGLAAFEVLMRFMQDGMAEGAFRVGDPRAAAFTAWAMVHEVTRLVLDRTGPLSAEDRAEIEARPQAADAIIMDGLRPR